MAYSIVDDWQKLDELKKLNDLSSPPENIFYSGTWDPQIFENCVAVVGSRRMTDYGRRVIEKIVTQLVSANKTIVSGFMYGVDQYTHQICLEQGGKTIAVLGWGIDWPITGNDKKLGEKIVENKGLLISEWKSQRPTLWTFPQRNRLITALSDEVIVVEAAERSGSLITARLAIKLKRKLWAVPGPITSKTSVGTNYLIAKGLAKPWLGELRTNQCLNHKDDPILSLLENESLDTDSISRILGSPVSQIAAQLSILLLSGVISERGGKYFLTDVN